MIEATNQEINVDELVTRIREEVARRRAETSASGPSLPSSPAKDAAVTIDWLGFRGNIYTAEQYAQIGTFLPGWDRFGRVKRILARFVGRIVLYATDFITNRQREFNGAVLQSLRLLNSGLPHIEDALAGQRADLTRLEELVRQVQASMANAEKRQRTEFERIEQAILETGTRVEQLEQRQQGEGIQQQERLQVVEQAFQGANARLEHLEQREGRLQVVEQAFQEMKARLEQLEQRQQGEGIQQQERLQVVEQAFQGANARLEHLEQREGRLQMVEQAFQGANARLEHLEQREGRLQMVEQAFQEMKAQLEQLEQRQQSEMSQLVTTGTQYDEQLKHLERTLTLLKTEFIMQDRRLTLLLEEARKRLPEPLNEEQLGLLAEEDRHRLDALYVSFEDQFRGTREEIKGRVKVYLPLLKEGHIGTEAMPIVDVGCGRGEWLEVLQEERLVARGVDINRVLIEQCRQMGLNVVEADLIAHLRSLPNNSIGAVTGFHIIEHLPLDSLIKLFDETVRVLKPGGIAIFETPNPQNLQVGACNFYFDPTHRNPLPSPTVRFLAEARGLCRVQVWDLHPFSDAWKLNGSELASRFNEFFYGPRDYAVVGWKA